MVAVLKRQWEAKTWAVFGVLVALFAPPLFFYIFEVLNYAFIYKCLMWLGFVLAVACLMKCFAFIGLLNRIADINAKRVIF
jgi:hypothetical protein